MPAKYKRYAQLPEFLRSFHRSCIERGENESVYDAFLGFSEERCRDVPRGELLAAARKARRSGPPADEREADLCMWYMARLHHRRFAWAYANLFRTYGSILRRDLDLVLWGSGCGIDLLALHEQALACEPGFWTRVRSVVVLEPSELLLERSREIARVLFPLAGSIVGRRYDWDNLLDVATAKDLLARQNRSPYVPGSTCSRT